MRITPRAESIVPVAERLVFELEVLVNGNQKFDPQTTKRRFRISTSDYVQAIMLPAIDARLRASPGIRLNVEPTSIDATGFDLTIVPAFRAARDHRVRHLFNDRLVCAFDSTMVEGGAMTLEVFCRLEHVLFAPAPSPGHDAVDEALTSIGHRRRIGPVLGHVSGLPALLVGVERLAILPERLIEAAIPGLSVRALPVFLKPIEMVMTWPAAIDQDAAHRWFRGEIATVAKAMS